MNFLERETRNRIQILPEYIANQIAAGEVVQRPESVVKELVENSLDAGATTIAIVIHKGGKQLIHIVDDGCGMSRDDLELSIRRHTTSKIYTAEDLEQILTYGFRGEALASIAAVSNLEIRTRRSDDETGWRLISDPNKEPIVEPFATDKGTQVFVRNLFYNVPARRKFLKSDLTEFRYISDTLVKIALCRNDIRFVFYDEDSLIFDVQPASTRERIKDLLGDLIYESIIEVDFSYNDIRVWGFVGQPHLAKTTRGDQYLYLNGRNIRSKSLTYAVFLAYEHLLEKQANPFFLLHIELDPKRYDVNVHPQKYEVKFDDEKFIFNVVNMAVSNALSQHNLAPSVVLRPNVEPLEKIPSTTPPDSRKFQLVNKITGEVIERESKAFPQDFPKEFRPKFKYSAPINHKLVENLEKIYPPLPETTTKQIETEKKWKSIHQVHNKFIILEKSEGIAIIDQHAAHERILFEKFKRAFKQNEQLSQPLLFPIPVQLDPVEFSTLKEIQKDLERIGFRFELFTNGSANLLAVPYDITNRDEVGIFKELIASFINKDTLATSNSQEYLIATLSCKAAIMTGQSLSMEEMESLVAQLYECEIPYSCPHGRPVIIELSLDELDKIFCRIL